MIMTCIKRITSGIAALIAVSVSAQVQVTATIDSVDVLQGRLRQVDVEVVQPESMTLKWLTDREEGEKSQVPVELLSGVEVNSASAIDTVRLGAGRIQLNRTLLIQPWDSGEFVVPGIALTAGQDTFRSSPFAIKVYTADIDTMMTIHSWGPAVSQPRGFFDWVPDWIADYWAAYLIGLLLIGGAIAAYVLKRKGGLREVLKPEEKPIPPYEKAMQQLEILKQRQLCEKGQEKTYYTELTEILRQYLEGRFGINAMEMTTPQIKRAVRATVPADAAPGLMNEVLEMADYVKFARLRPLPEDNVRAFNQAMTFIENTRPAAEAADSEGKEGKR